MSSTVPTSEDVYEILGVSKDATDSEIQRAYRKLALKYHPDRKPDDKSAAEKFKKASEAYEILKDPEKRRVYDTRGMEGIHRAGFHGFENNEEIYAHFGDLFSHLFGGQAQPGRQHPQRGHDLRFAMTVGFNTAALGSRQSIEVPVPVHCDSCKGTGILNSQKSEACDICSGSGQIARRAAEQGGYFTITSPCPACSGAGFGGGSFCPRCNGEGLVQSKKQVSVTIPAGIESGKVLRLKEQGQPGIRGGPHGDLLIEINVRSDSRFTRDGNNIRSDAKIPLLTALMGGKVDVVTIHGTVSMSVPPGTSSDTTMRIRGQGIESKGVKGDHLVRVVVTLPKKAFSEEDQTQLTRLLQ